MTKKHKIDIEGTLESVPTRLVFGALLVAWLARGGWQAIGLGLLGLIFVIGLALQAMGEGGQIAVGLVFLGALYWFSK